MTCKGFFFSRKISILDKETPSNGIFRHYFNFNSCSIGWFRYLVPLRSHFGSLSKILPGFAIRQCHLSLPLLFVSGTPDIHCGVHFYDGGNCFWKIRSRSLPLGLQSSKEFHIVWKLLKMPHFIFFNLAFPPIFVQLKVTCQFWAFLMNFCPPKMLNETFSEIFKHREFSKNIVFNGWWRGAAWTALRCGAQNRAASWSIKDDFH